MRARVVSLAALHLVIAAVVHAVAWRVGLVDGVTLVAVPVALAIALVGSIQMHVEFGRHAHGVTLVEAVLVASLLHLGAADVAAAVVLGELVACARRRQPVLKMVFNASSAALAGSAAAVTFAAFPTAGLADWSTCAAALLAAGVYAVSSHASTSAVLAIVEGTRFHRLFCDSIAPSVAATAVSASIGLIAVVLATVGPAGPLLVAPLVGLMVLETRRLAAHKAEHLRFERLYAASARTAGLQGTADVLATLAAEARSLVTGAAALCCTVDRDGTWHGVVVDDTGAQPADRHVVRAVLAISRRREGAQFAVEQVPAALRRLLPAMAGVLVARSADDAAAPVVLAVIRDLADDGGEGRGAVLDAFIGHAALTVANARLYEDVETALAHQVDLNRQKDDFVAVVSHELRTPLTAMIGSVSTLRRMDERLTPEHRTTLVDMALRQGSRLQRLIEELLQLATVEHSTHVTQLDQDVDIRSLVTDVVRELRDSHRASDLDVQFETLGLPTVRTDEQKVRQIVGNLVENACKYAPGAPVRVRARLEGADVVIDVVDHGPGIAPEDRERVFERFVQLDSSSTRSQGGTGLGLYLCRQLAKVLGGTLVLTEAETGGCCFTLTLPRIVLDLSDEPATLEVVR